MIVPTPAATVVTYPGRNILRNVASSQTVSP